MRQLDIVRLQGRELAVVLQCDLPDECQTRVVTPLIAASEVRAVARLHPIIRVGRSRHVPAMEQLSAVHSGAIAQGVGAAAVEECEIRRALDIVLIGV